MYINTTFNKSRRDGVSTISLYGASDLDQDRNLVPHHFGQLRARQGGLGQDVDENISATLTYGSVVALIDELNWALQQFNNEDISKTVAA